MSYLKVIFFDLNDEICEIKKGSRLNGKVIDSIDISSEEKTFLIKFSNKNEKPIYLKVKQMLAVEINKHNYEKLIT